MDIVIDASAIIAVAANEKQKDALIRLTTGVDLIAPASVHFEIGNAISAMLKRRRILSEQAAQLVEQYQSIPLRFVDIELSESILIAQQYNIYAYDAYLLRCAEKYRCPLLTLDEALRHHARAHGLVTLEVV